MTGRWGVRLGTTGVWLGCASLWLAVWPSSAPAEDPLELARALRENEQPDLALLYLADLQKKSPPAAVQVLIPLEVARANLELANETGDRTLRGKYISLARRGFEEFLQNNPSHPRRAEALLSLARLISVQARGELTAANRLNDPEASKAAKLQARKTFQTAATQFGTAATAFKKQLDSASPNSPERRRLEADFYQAKLDQGINLFSLADTYPTLSASADDTLARGKAIDQAKDVFKELVQLNADHPQAWVAKAWISECEREKTNMNEVTRLLDEIKKAGLRDRNARAGALQARFFEMRAEYVKAFSEANRAQAFRRAQTAIENWLTEARRSKRPPGYFAALYYLAKSKEYQANYKYDDKTKQVTFQGNAKQLLTDAEKDLRRLQDPENEYTEKAADDRTKIIRLLIGDPSQLNPQQLKDFDYCLMAAQVQLSNTLQAPADDRARLALQTVRLFERLQQLPMPRDLQKESQRAQAGLIYAYLLAGQPYEAATLGEELARTIRSGTIASQAGLYAIMGYRQAGIKLDPADLASREADLERAVRLGFFLDRTYPDEEPTDAARMIVAELLLQSRRWKEAFDLSANVRSESRQGRHARFFQSLAAYELLRPNPVGEDPRSRLTDPQKNQLYQAIVAALSSAPPVDDNTPAADARLAILTQLQLAEMHFLQGETQLPKVEVVCQQARKQLDLAKSLVGDERDELQHRIELSLSRSLYGQALKAFQAKQYEVVFQKIGPSLNAAKQSGPLAKAGGMGETHEVAKRVDEFRRERLLGLAIQTRIREGKIDQIAELLEVVKKLGGNLANSSVTLGQLVEGARPQIDNLRQEGKTEEAQKLIQGIGEILDKVAAEPDVTPATLLVLGQGLTSIGNFAKAEEFLKKIPPPADMESLKKRSNEIPEEQQPVVARYKLAQLELARTYRQSGRFAEAETILKVALPTRDQNNRETPGTGWSSPADYKREAAYLTEAKAAAAMSKPEALKLWGEARQQWSEQANSYLAPLRRLLAGKNDPKSAMIILSEFRQLPPHPRLPKADAEMRAGLASPNPPEWLTELLAPEGPYASEMRATINRIESQLKPIYHEFLFETLRCLTMANQQIYKDDPAKLGQSLTGIAKSIFELEKANPDLAEAVKVRFAGLLRQVPALQEEYRKQGGQTLLEPMP